MMNHSFAIRLGLGLLVLIHAIGCGSGPKRAAVTGKVTLDGEPLEKGVIVFQPIEPTKSPSSGGDINKGLYHVFQEKGPMLGVFRVEVSALRKTGKKIAAGSPAPQGTMVDEYVEAIPARYAGESSTLRAEVKADQNTLNFDLVSK